MFRSWEFEKIVLRNMKLRDMKMEKPINTDDLTDLEVAKLWRGLEQVDEAINNVIHVPSFNFAEQREKAIAALQELRKQQAMLVQAIHKLKNQIGRK